MLLSMEIWIVEEIIQYCQFLVAVAMVKEDATVGLVHVPAL